MRKFNKVLATYKRTNLELGDTISVSEKLDGANASFSFSPDGELEVFSRNQQLDEHNTLQGFWGYAHETILPKIESIPSKGNFIFYGEWLIPHAIAYHEEHYKKFYLFSIWDKQKETFLESWSVRKFAKVTGFRTPKHLYSGDFEGLDKLTGFVGETDMAEFGEGIVIFNESKRDSEFPFYKIVSDTFKESKGERIRKVKDLTASEAWILTHLTEARVHKCLYKIRDLGNLPSVEFANFGSIAKLASEAVWEDIIEEEFENAPELLDREVSIKKVKKVTPNFVRSFIEKESGA